MIYLETVGPVLLTKIPMLLLWLAGIVLSVLMLRRGGAKAETLLLAGCAIKFVEQIYGSFYPGVIAYLSEGQGYLFTSVGSAAAALLWSGVALGLAGFVCLILAFWMKFRSSLRREQGDGSGEAT